MTVLEEISQAVADAAERTAPAVVGVGAGGSGVVVKDGLVLTNAHNVRGDVVVVTFADGRRVEAQAAGVDIDGDLAVLRVDTASAPTLGTSDRAPRRGETVLALANPGGRGVRVSTGVVSALQVSFRGPGGRRVDGAIEHTAPLARGSSGGPVTDLDGKLLGIDTHRVGDGFYLALPAGPTLQERIDALGRGEVPRRVRLGIAVAHPRVARRLRRSVGLPDRDGLLVQAVEDGGPAAGAGLRQGDLIVRVGTRDVTTVDELADALAGSGSGAVEVLVVRGTDERTVSVDLADAAKGDPAA